MQHAKVYVTLITADIMRNNLQNNLLPIPTHQPGNQDHNPPSTSSYPRVPLVVLALHDIHIFGMLSAQKYQMFIPECNKSVSPKICVVIIFLVGSEICYKRLIA